MMSSRVIEPTKQLTVSKVREQYEDSFVADFRYKHQLMICRMISGIMKDNGIVSITRDPETEKLSFDVEEPNE